MDVLNNCLIAVITAVALSILAFALGFIGATGATVACRLLTILWPTGV